MDKNKETNISDRSLELTSKTQKIVTALYMVSDLIPAHDPVRRQLRTSSVGLASLVARIAIQSPSRAKKTITEAQNCIDTLTDLLRVSVSIGFVSDMNFKIIVESLILVRDDLNYKYGLLNSDSSLKNSFHNRAIEEFVLPSTLWNSPTVPKSEPLKGSVTEVSKPKESPVSYKTNIKDTVSVVKDKEMSNIKLSHREDRIMEIIKTKHEVSVSDVSAEFPEVSEKTIQRMLSKLVEEGKLGKTGEKRWSRYSLMSL